MIIYDLECCNSPVYNKRRSNYIYAKNWNDYQGMGIAVVSVYNYETDKLLSFYDKDIKKPIQLQRLIKGSGIVSGFNIKKYDNPMLRAHKIEINDSQCYDILEQLWFASGLTGNYDYKTHGGYSLDKVLAANFEDKQKLMSGADAPFLWQDGYYHKVIEYCESDVMLEKALLDKIFETGGLINPRTGKFVRMAIPHE